MDYPRPFIVEPLQLPHKQTFILLHGRGSSGHKFGPLLLETPFTTANAPISPSQGLTLATAFPQARFVFPSAARRRATIYKRAYTHQWFDNWKLDPPATDREDLQVDGLRETVAYLHGLLRAEIELVPGGAGNVVFGGLSQGCAAALTALLLWEGDKLGAAVGMCGWLPFAESLLEQIEGDAHAGEADSGDSSDPFARDDEHDEHDGVDLDSGAVAGSPAAAVGWLRDELQLDERTVLSVETPVFQQTTVFLGHGVQDDRVSVALGRRASECLAGLKGTVCWNEYAGLGHWFSEDMLRDLVDFILEETGWHS